MSSLISGSSDTAFNTFIEGYNLAGSEAAEQALLVRKHELAITAASILISKLHEIESVRRDLEDPRGLARAFVTLYNGIEVRNATEAMPLPLGIVHLEEEKRLSGRRQFGGELRVVHKELGLIAGISSFKHSLSELDEVDKFYACIAQLEIERQD